MKVSNETKVGALTAIAITVLILGFNYLKGKNITERSHTIYAVFPAVDGLTSSTGVLINGYQVGRVSSMTAKDANLSGIVVAINLSKNVNIPTNSIASIDKSLLGSSSLRVTLGNSGNYINDGDTLLTSLAPDLMSQFKSTLDPAMDNINRTLVSLDAVIQKLNSIIDPNVKNNLQATIANLASSSQSLNAMLNSQTGALAKSLTHVESITNNLAKNNGRIDSTLSNVQRTTAKLAEAKIGETFDDLRKTVGQLESIISKANSTNGTLGALLNDRKLYDELRQTNRSLTILLDDFKTNPKRYVNVSVFGKKDKSAPLGKPIFDSIPGKGNQ
ncbi:MAG: MCE family protein [Chitinophagaceae bacterium]|nr:MCE family protein [Chitinophagaceae bacterium]